MASELEPTSGRRRGRASVAEAETAANGAAPSARALDDLLRALNAAAAGDFSARLPARYGGVMGELADAYNRMAEGQQRASKELARVGRAVGRDGRIAERAVAEQVSGAWATNLGAVNELIEDLVRPTAEIGRVVEAVARGDFSQRIPLESDGRAAKGEYLRVAKAVNAMTDQLSSFAAEVTRVAREVGTEGTLGGQVRVKGATGAWADLTESVNLMAANLTSQVRSIAQVATAVANGDLSQKISVDAKGEVAALADTINRMVDQLSSFADEVTRVAVEVGVEGKLGGQADVPGVAGTWRALTESVNLMASNLTDQVRNIAQVTTAVANGDLTQQISVDAQGEILELEADHQHHGRPALLVRGRGHPRGPRGGHGRQARRPGRGAGRRRAPGRASPTRSTSWPTTSPARCATSRR